MFRSPSLYAAICALSLIGLGACGNSAGGGGGGVKFVGAPAGSVCDTTYHNEGCLAGAAPVKTVKCVDNAGTKTWQDKGVCGANQYCVEESDPGDPNGIKKLAICKDVPVTPTGADTVTGDAANGSDGGSTTDAGPKKTVAEQYACLASKCPTETSACMANATCAQAVNCAKACADKTCRDACGQAALNDQTVFKLLLDMTQCGGIQKCIDTSPTGPVCGDGSCDGGETTASCAADCKETTGPKCGNETCEEGESPTTCPADCKAAPKCGNELCEAGESYATCPTDCQCKSNADCGTGKVCTDGVCKTEPTGAKCGNFACEAGETATGCPVDCNPEAIKALACTKENCASDWNKCQSSPKCADALLCMTKCTDEACVIACATKEISEAATLQSLKACVDKNCSSTTPGPTCGDGKCESPETSTSCAADCKAAGGTCTGHADCQVKKGEACDTATSSCVSNNLAGSCAGQCGSTTKQGDCYCDSDCLTYGDCCKDWCAAP